MEAFYLKLLSTPSTLTTRRTPPATTKWSRWLHEKLAAATVPADKELYQRQIKATDRQIDRLVYELYGLGATDRSE